MLFNNNGNIKQEKNKERGKNSNILTITVKWSDVPFLTNQTGLV